MTIRTRPFFLKRLGNKVTEGKCTIYAWVLMSNQLHILLKSGKIVHEKY